MAISKLAWGHPSGQSNREAGNTPPHQISAKLGNAWQSYWWFNTIFRPDFKGPQRAPVSQRGEFIPHTA